MSTLDKFNLIVTRRAELDKNLSDKADALLTRLQALPAKADEAFQKHNAKLDAETKSLDELEHAIDALTNGNSDPLAH